MDAVTTLRRLKKRNLQLAHAHTHEHAPRDWWSSESGVTSNLRTYNRYTSGLIGSLSSETCNSPLELPSASRDARPRSLATCEFLLLEPRPRRFSSTWRRRGVEYREGRRIGCGQSAHIPKRCRVPMCARSSALRDRFRPASRSIPMASPSSANGCPPALGGVIRPNDRSMPETRATVFWRSARGFHDGSTT